MTEEERKNREADLAVMARLPKDATIEDFMRLRFNIIIPEKPKLH